MNIDEAKQYVNSVRWQYAKTYPKAPHEYTVLSWNQEYKQKMIDFAYFIVENGRDEFYYKKKFKVLDIDEYKYWTMDYPLEKTDLINRTYNDDVLKDKISKYTTSNIFDFKKGMTLEDIRREYEIYSSNCRA